MAKGFLRFLAVAYTKHPYAWTAGGTIKDLDATSPADLQKFYDAYYQPNNAMLVVVGKTTAAQVKASAEKWFGPIAKAGDPPRPAKDDAGAAADREATRGRRAWPDRADAGRLARPGGQGQGCLRASGRVDHPRRWRVVAAQAFGSSRSIPRPSARSRSTAACRPLIHEDPGMVIAARRVPRSRRRRSRSRPRSSTRSTSSARGARAPTSCARRRTRSSPAFVFSLENAQGLAEAIGRSWIHTGDPSSFLRDVDEVEKVTAADVQRVVKQYLTQDHATVVVIPPPTAPSTSPAGAPTATPATSAPTRAPFHAPARVPATPSKAPTGGAK